MPSNKATPALNTSKHVRTESTRKREGREHAEASKRERSGKKAAAKARKDFRDEAADNDLLVERDGESTELTKLRAYTLQLETDNQRMKSKLARREEQDVAPPVKIIPAPESKGEIDVEVLRQHLGLAGEENDVKWSSIRSDFRAVLVAGGLDWDTTWGRQDVDRVNTLYHVAETRRPEMKRFANHWATEYLLKESYGNLYFYHHRQANKQPDASTPQLPKSGAHGSSRGSDDNRASRSSDDNRTSWGDNHTTDAQPDLARKAAAHKAAAYRSADRKAAKRKADTQDVDDRDSHLDDDGTPYNDGETEIEEVSADKRKEIEENEIGVSKKSKHLTKVAVKPTLKHPGSRLPSTSTPKPRKPSHTRPEMSNVPTSSSSTALPPKDSPNASSGPKAWPMIRVKRGRGGKVVCGGRGEGRGSAPVADVSSDDSSAHDEAVLSPSSGQTTSESGSDED